MSSPSELRHPPTNHHYPQRYRQSTRQTQTHATAHPSTHKAQPDTPTGANEQLAMTKQAGQEDA
eukprot:2619724-Alexandrium_andersonii.AAC.1